MFLPQAKCSHLFWNCWWKIDKSQDQDGDRGRERGIVKDRKRVEAEKRNSWSAPMAQKEAVGGGGGGEDWRYESWAGR